MITYFCYVQLLANTIQHEKPELEVRKTELLKQEEDLKIQLAQLEESLLEVKNNGIFSLLCQYSLCKSGWNIVFIWVGPWGTHV